MLTHWALKEFLPHPCWHCKKGKKKKEENKIGCCSAVLLQKNKSFSWRRLEGVELLYLVPLYISYLFAYCVAVNSLTCVLMLFVNDKISF